LSTNASDSLAVHPPVLPAVPGGCPATASPPGRRRLTASLAAVLLALTATVAASSPAYAATPQCTYDGWFHYIDVNGDKLLGVASPSYIDYSAGAPAARYSDGSWCWSCAMSKGANSAAVFRLQSDINACYSSRPQPGGVKLGPNLAEDADFGPATKAALIRVQQYRKIAADGVYGPQTALAMRHASWAYSGDIGTGTFCHTLGG
jgi:peptidoglycan hydrolase-like protein with peptidoglycan-binding domain